MFKFLFKVLIKEFENAGVSTDLPRVTVEHVIDGDTVIVKQNWSEIRIRLYGIDCPEDGQPWGDIATAGLIKMVGGKDIYLEAHGVDKHDRTLGTIYTWNGKEFVNVNERMVMLGHAWVMRALFDQLPRERQEKLNRLERWARSKRVGLWKADKPIPPWQWRKK